MTLDSIAPAIVPFDPTIGVTVVATIMLALSVAFMVYIAFVMPGWSGSPNTAELTEAQNAD
ncbi:hypothetical protein [Natrononativus amylolyticus]|uniref:hypothetical protein n=1 Tax=Natrononativus amylolyticus TaxID=2963434 RepID=UPI0020CC4F9E|nr:hypothetical protein [Natrononativus amylolyticus]